MQYFGNVITCRWWDEIWLNEGFARFYQYVGMDMAEPDWEMVRRLQSSVGVSVGVGYEV